MTAERPSVDNIRAARSEKIMNDALADRISEKAGGQLPDETQIKDLYVLSTNRGTLAGMAETLARRIAHNASLNTPKEWLSLLEELSPNERSSVIRLVGDALKYGTVGVIRASTVDNLKPLRPDRAAFLIRMVTKPDTRD